MPTTADLPKYWQLMYPTLRAVDSLGGSAQARAITEAVIEQEGFSEQLLQLLYPNRPDSVLIDRLDWARSSCKLAGVLDSPQRGFFVLTQRGRDLLAESEGEAREALRLLNRQARAARRQLSATDQSETVDGAPEDSPPGEVLVDADWRELLLLRLQQLSPEGFERFCIFLLGLYGHDLRHVGGSGDGGIDGLGTAPVSPVFSVTVAVQAKKYTSDNPVGRDAVALFQRDAAAAGAERAVMMTTGRFTGPAQRAAREARPTVDLIDGERICDLVLEKQQQIAGLQQRYFVDVGWFGQFEPLPTPRP